LDRAAEGRTNGGKEEGSEKVDKQAIDRQAVNRQEVDGTPQHGQALHSVEVGQYQSRRKEEGYREAQWWKQFPGKRAAEQQRP